MEKDSFVSICLEENLVQSSIWNIKEESVNILSSSPAVNYDDDETLVTACDECLSGCVQTLPENIEEPSKAIFGVPAYWISEGQIQRAYLDKIRLICNKLSLNPTGFVSLPEAIAHLEKNLNTPLSGILIGIYKGSIDVSFFRLGNLAGTVNVARSLNLVEDVIEGIARFDLRETIPSKFLLYDGHANDLDEIKQELIKADWNNLNEKIRFLHTPTIEIVDPDSKMASICLAGGAEIANLSKINFKNTNIQKASDIVEEIPQASKTTDNNVDLQALGFHVSKQPKPTSLNLRKLKLPSINIRSLKKLPIKENALFLGSIALILLFASAFGLYWFVPKADVDVFISPVKIDETKDVKLDTKANQIDVSKLIVPAKSVEITISSDKTKETSGTKTIGTPAKGSVTFYNVGGATVINKGTILSSHNLKYSLDDDVTIASASGAAQTSTATGNITAIGVGADYNLGEGTIFSVGNFSSSLIQAKNDNALSGGTSQEVAAVSENDIASLTKSLSDELLQKGKDKLKENLNGNILIDNKTTITTISQSSDHKEGEEASTVRVSLTAKITALTVSRNDMITLAKGIFKDKVGKGFTMKDDQVDFIINDKNVEFKINLLPSIDTSKLASQIAGKNLKDAKQTLSQVPGFDDVKFALKPDISFMQTLPHIAKNIYISLSAR